MPDAMGVEELRSTDDWGRTRVDHRVTGGRGGAQEEQLMGWRLRCLVKEAHDAWWAGRGQATHPFDVTSAGAWHPRFPLDSTPPVPRAEVTRPAEVRAAQSLLDAVIARRQSMTPTPSTPSSSSAASAVMSVVWGEGEGGGTPSSVGERRESIGGTSVVSADSTPFTARGRFVEQFKRRARVEQLSSVDRETPEQLQRLQHLGKLPQLLDLLQ